MKDLIDLSKRIGVNLNYLLSLIHNSQKFYRSYYINKSSGGTRAIDSPSIPLKSIQAWILRNILEKVIISDRTYGFVKKRSIKDNAKIHLGKKYILSVDIKDFFSMTKEIKIYNFFHKLFPNRPLADGLTKLCVYKKRLPQGAVTSPALSNIVFLKADDEILKLCNSLDIEYSRYADDISFSTNDISKLKLVLPLVTKIIRKHGYTLNKVKTRYLTGKRKMSVTGLTLNSKSLSIGRKRKALIRARLHNYIMNGKIDITLNQLLGELAYLRDIEPQTYKNIMMYKNKLKNKKLKKIH